MTRLERLRTRMTEQGVDLLALSPGAHMAWLLDIHPHVDERAMLFCLTPGHAAFLMPALEIESVRKQTDLPFFAWSDGDGPDGAMADLLSDFGITNPQTIALDECMRADHAALIQDRFPQASRQFCESTLGELRMRKDADEYAIIKRNALQADRAMQVAWDQIRPGMTELDVAQIVRDSFAADGAVKTLFAIVGTGANGSMPHHHTGNTVIADGDALLMDIGAKFEGYSSDITRMAYIGTPSAEYEQIHTIVEAAVQAALDAARPGVLACEVDDAARAVITDAGYGEYFVTRTGHGLGTEGHEPPYISASSKVVLDEGMVFSIEPGIYMPGKFGLRLEEIVILRADGPEIFSEMPRDVRVIG